MLVKTIIFRQSSGGGSTITQQLAKNLFPREELNIFELVVRKIKEWIIAAQLEKSYTKQEIIAMYLNTVPFGSNSFGVRSAARTFFNVFAEARNVLLSGVKAIHPLLCLAKILLKFIGLVILICYVNTSLQYQSR